MTYYFSIIDNKIISKGQCKLTNAINIEVTKEIFDNSDKYIYHNEQIVLDPDYEAKQAQAEAERVAKLTMTSLDFINFLEESGLTLEEITTWLDLPENLRVKTQLTYCQSVYCGVACALMPIKLGDIEITKEMVIEAFKAKYEE